MSRWLSLVVLVWTIALLPACENVSTGQPAALGDEPAVFELSDFEQEGTVYPIDVHDPLEPLNRAVYKFNAMFDRAIFIPITELYEFATPTFAQERVSSFFSNLTELNTFANSILQANLERASRAMVRFAVNSTVGLAGLFDPMTALGTNQQREDLGQTFGTWGAGEGPYLVLPILGPSNLRDTAGLIGDTVAYRVVDPFGLASFESDYPVILALRAVDQRHNQGFRYHETGSPFEYELLRLLYTEMRRLDISK